MRDGRRPIWVSRPLLDWRGVAEWLRTAGVRKCVPPDQMHLTLATVRTPVDWDGLELRDDTLTIPPGPKPTRIFAWTIKALSFEDPAVSARHAELLRLFPAMDHPTLRAHVSLYKGGRMPTVEYDGPLTFGPERAVEFDADDARGVKHARVADLVDAD